MSIETMYLAKYGAEDCHIDAASHTVPVSASVTRSVTGLAAYFMRIDGSNSGTGPWTTDDVMTASYFVATSAGTASVFPVATVSTTLNVVNASTFQVDATSLDCAVAANFTAAVVLTGGGTSNTFVVGTDPTGTQVLRAASARFTTLEVAGNANLQAALTITGTVGIGGNVGLGGTLAVTGASTLTGAVALNGGATVPSGQTLTIASGGTLTVSGTLNITTFTASTAVIAGASGGSEVLKTTTFRATGASVLVGDVTASGAMTVGGNFITAAGATLKGTTTIDSAGGIAVAGTAGLFQLPAASDTATTTTLDLDALHTSNSHQFGPSGARTLGNTGVTGTRSGAYWFINTHATNAVTIHADQMDTPSGTFTLAANTTAVLWWDANTSKFFQISH